MKNKETMEAELGNMTAVMGVGKHVNTWAKSLTGAVARDDKGAGI